MKRCNLKRISLERLALTILIGFTCVASTSKEEFTDAKWGFTVTPPPGWKLDTESERHKTVVAMFRPSENPNDTGVDVRIIAQHVNEPSDTRKFAEMTLQSVKQRMPNAQINPQVSTKLGPFEAVRITYSLPAADPEEVFWQSSTFAYVAGVYYGITYSAYGGAFDRHQPVVDAMTSSFKLNVVPLEGKELRFKLGEPAMTIGLPQGWRLRPADMGPGNLFAASTWERGSAGGPAIAFGINRISLDAVPADVPRERFATVAAESTIAQLRQRDPNAKPSAIEPTKIGDRAAVRIAYDQTRADKLMHAKLYIVPAAKDRAVYTFTFVTPKDRAADLDRVCDEIVGGVEWSDHGGSK